MLPPLRPSKTLQHDLSRQLAACHSKSRRNGKVARLPAHLRFQINLMLEDGIAYKTIIQRLGDAGKHLNEDNVSNWRLGGYQDYLKAQILKERAGYQMDAVANIARESSDLDPAMLQRACTQIAMLQYMDTLLEHGQQIANESLKDNPAKMITLINSICKLSHTALSFEKNRAREAPNAPPVSHQPANPRKTTRSSAADSGENTHC